MPLQSGTENRRQRQEGRRGGIKTKELYRPYNPNPNKNIDIDCTVRAISKATGKSWDDIYIVLSAYGYFHKRVFTANSVWGAYLRSQGFKRYIVDDHGQDQYTVEDFCKDHPQGNFILGTGTHALCVKDGKFYDVWNSGNETPIYYFMKDEE